MHLMRFTPKTTEQYVQAGGREADPGAGGYSDHGANIRVQCRPGYCRQVLTCDGQRDALAHGGRDVVLGDAEVGAAVPPGDGGEGDQGAGHAVRVGTWAVCVETGGTIVAVYWWPSPRGAVTLSVDNHHCPQLLSALCVSPHRTSAGSVSPSHVSR